MSFKFGSVSMHLIEKEEVTMVELVSEETNARKILRIYQYFNLKVGDVLRANNFIAVGRKYNWDMRDLQDGLDYAIDNKWLERTPSGWLALTKLGSKEM